MLTTEVQKPPPRDLPPREDWGVVLLWDDLIAKLLDPESAILNNSEIEKEVETVRKAKNRAGEK